MAYTVYRPTLPGWSSPHGGLHGLHGYGWVWKHATWRFPAHFLPVLAQATRNSVVVTLVAAILSGFKFSFILKNKSILKGKSILPGKFICFQVCEVE